MPHFIVDCSEDVITKMSPEEIMRAVYDAAESTGLFAKNDIKVRINPYQHYLLGEGKTSFIHIFSYIMEGRTVGQKADLSEKIVKRLDKMFPDISILSMNVKEFELATYSNKSLINPLNTGGDRFFKKKSNASVTFRPLLSSTHKSGIPFIAIAKNIYIKLAFIWQLNP